MGAIPCRREDGCIGSLVAAHATFVAVPSALGVKEPFATPSVETVIAVPVAATFNSSRHVGYGYQEATLVFTLPTFLTIPSHPSGRTGW